MRLIVLLVLCGLAADAQVVARQGEPERQQFRSPMILELPLKNYDKLPDGHGRNVSDEVAKFACEGVTFTKLLVSSERRRNGAGVSIEAELSNEPSHDKSVQLRLEIVAGEDVLATASIPSPSGERASDRAYLEIEENERRSVRGSVIVQDRERFDRAVSAEPTAILRLTLSVTEGALAVEERTRPVVIVPVPR